MAVSKKNRIQASVVVTIIMIVLVIFLITLAAIIMIFVEIPGLGDIFLLRN